MSVPKECPDLKICRFRVPRDYYARVCTGNFTACRIYAEKRKLLKCPFEWVQWLAIEQSEIVIHR